MEHLLYRSIMVVLSDRDNSCYSKKKQA